MQYFDEDRRFFFLTPNIQTLHMNTPQWNQEKVNNARAARAPALRVEEEKKRKKREQEQTFARSFYVNCLVKGIDASIGDAIQKGDINAEYSFFECRNMALCQLSDEKTIFISESEKLSNEVLNWYRLGGLNVKTWRYHEGDHTRGATIIFDT